MRVSLKRRLTDSGSQDSGELFLILLEIEQRLRFNHRYLVRVGGKRVYMQLASSYLKVNIAKRLQSIDFQPGEFDKHAAVVCEALKVGVTLPIQIGTHLLDLKIGHITYPSAQSAFVRPWAAELKTLNQSSVRQHLPGSAYNLAEANIPCKDTGNMSAPGNPDKRLVFVGF